MKTILLLSAFAVFAWAADGENESYLNEVSTPPNTSTSPLEQELHLAVFHKPDALFHPLKDSNYREISWSQAKDFGVLAHCDGKWYQESSKAEKRESFVCVQNGLADGPFFELIDQKLMVRAEYAKGIEKERTEFTHYPKKHIVYQRKYVATEGDYILMNTSDTSCVAPSTEKIQFRNDIYKRPLVEITMDGKTTSYSLDVLLEHEQKKEGNKSLPTTGIEAQGQQIDHDQRSAALSYLLEKGAIAEPMKESPAGWVDVSEGWIKCKSGQRLRRREGITGVSTTVREEACFVGDQKHGSHISKVMDAHRNVMQIYKTEFVKDEPKRLEVTEPGGERPLTILEPFNRNYKGFVLTNMTLNECTQPHTTKITFEKIDGKYVLKREGMNNAGHTFQDMPIPFSIVKGNLDKIYKQPENKGVMAEAVK